MSRHEAERFTHHGLSVRIFSDEDPESPREWDNLGTIYYSSSSRYVLGDKGLNSAERGELAERIAREEVIALPVYAYIHSGVTMNTTGFSCPWDSGQSGWIVAELDDVEREFGAITEEVKKRVLDCLRGEIATYGQFLCGDVYGYEVVRIVHCNKCGNDEEIVEDSCWGFYGLDYCIEEAKEAAESAAVRIAETNQENE